MHIIDSKLLLPFKWLIAVFRLNNNIVCEMSKSKGLCDYHDYPDSEDNMPLHMVVHKCKRCRKDFIM